MSLDFGRLEKVRARGTKIIARCPACAELGSDSAGDHLVITGDGRFGCIMFAGDAGEEHRRRIFELVGERSADHRPVLIERPTVHEKAKPRLPDLRPLSWQEMTQIAFVRGWVETGGLHELTRRGLLWFGMVWDAGQKWPAWIVTDSSQRNAQARRLDGQLWAGIEAKAKTLPGCDASWPIGAADIGSRPLVLLCEGGPDFLAALYVAAWEGFDTQKVAPVCICGAGNSIHPDALPLFAGRRVRITVHDDEKGTEAGHRWAIQLRTVGAVVDGFRFDGLAKPDGEPVKDLAEFARLFDSGEAPAEILTAHFTAAPRA